MIEYQEFALSCWGDVHYKCCILCFDCSSGDNKVTKQSFMYPVNPSLNNGRLSFSCLWSAIYHWRWGPIYFNSYFPVFIIIRLAINRAPRLSCSYTSHISEDLIYMLVKLTLYLIVKLTSWALSLTNSGLTYHFLRDDWSINVEIQHALFLLKDILTKFSWTA